MQAISSHFLQFFVHFTFKANIEYAPYKRQNTPPEHVRNMMTKNMGKFKFQVER